jgi:hypothetical protein
VIIGDSFTEAGNVPEAETYARLLDRRLSLATRNLGRAGYGPQAELVVLRKYGLNCHPKVVIWQIAESDDLDDSVRYQQWIQAGRPKVFDPLQDVRWTRLKVWQQRSPSFRLFEALRDHNPRSWPFEGLFRDQEGIEHVVRFLNIPDVNMDVQQHPGWPGLTNSLNEGLRLCSANQIQLVAVLVPDKYRVLGAQTRMRDPTIPPSLTPEFETKGLGVALEDYFASRGVPFVDTTAALRGRTRKGELVYLPYDTHLSAKGHELVADLIVERINPLIPASGPH